MIKRGTYEDMLLKRRIGLVLYCSGFRSVDREVVPMNYELIGAFVKLKRDKKGRSREPRVLCVQGSGVMPG